MPAIVLVGAQWGDEGKGKATDLLGSRVDYVVKFNGGNNAGHTVVIGDKKYALHLLPSGILTPGVTPVISNGVVVDVEVLFDELGALTEIPAGGFDACPYTAATELHLHNFMIDLDWMCEECPGLAAFCAAVRGYRLLIVTVVLTPKITPRTASSSTFDSLLEKAS